MLRLCDAIVNYPAVDARADGLVAKKSVTTKNQRWIDTSFPKHLTLSREQKVAS
jgi:hypothetical protein